MAKGMLRLERKVKVDEHGKQDISLDLICDECGRTSFELFLLFLKPDPLKEDDLMEDNDAMMLPDDEVMQRAMPINIMLHCPQCRTGESLVDALGQYTKGKEE